MKPLPQIPELVSKLIVSLGKCPLFANMESKVLQDLATQAKWLQAEPGEFLTQEGSVCDAFYIVLKGQAVVLIRHPEKKEAVELAQLVAGDSFGDVALLLGRSNLASVRASSVVVAARFEGAVFHRMVEQDPAFGFMMAKSLASRLERVVRLLPVPEHTEEEGIPSPDTVSLLPFEFVERHRAVPLRAEGNTLTIGFVDEPSSATLKSIRELLPGMELRPVRMDATLFDKVLRTQAGISPPQMTVQEGGIAEGSLERLLRAMVAQGASDLHLSAGHRPRWRIDGDMQEIADAPIFGKSTAFELLAPVIEERFRTQFEQTNDVDFAYTSNGIRFRTNLFRDTNGTSAVFRHINSKIPSLEQLGMPEVVTRFCAEPKGLVLVTGPTGSGKSTTLAAMIDLINKTRREHILTLEDPVEFVHASKLALVNQREVGSHTQSFGRALRAALREDPDIVLVGEMRDLETVALALETANTGHLVFGTLHTANAILTTDRIVSLFPAEQQEQIRATLGDVLRGVVSQTLCRRVGGGRVAALEVMVVNPAVANLIREGKTNQIPSIMQTGKALGNQLLNDSLASLVQAGKVDYEEAISRAVDKVELARRLNRKAL